MESLTIYLFSFKKVFTWHSRRRLFYLCLLKIAEPVCERICELIKHPIVIVLASEYTLLSYWNVSSVIPWEKHHFYPANGVWKNRKSLFIAESRSDFNRCYEQRIGKPQLNTIYSSLFVILKRCKVQKTDIQGF